jgi:hypothetical protein
LFPCPRFSKKWVQSHIDEIRKAGLDIPLVLQEYNLKPPFEYDNERTEMFKAVSGGKEMQWELSSVLDNSREADLITE